MTYAIILAGGAGTRFWPLSRITAPKQFLNIYSDKPLISETIARINQVINKNNIYIATNKIHHKHLKKCLRNLNIPKRNIFLEPLARNTLAPIVLLSKNIYNQDKQAIILVLPCDHYIRGKEKYLCALEKAIRLARQGFIVTFGIPPQWPETGYGYIKVKSKVYKVDRFIEKPDLIRAKKFLKDKKYYWNAGIFVFRADVLLQEVKKFTPQNYKVITKIKDKKSLNQLWPRLTSTSIDYAVMEKTAKMALIPADFAWLDLGSWEAVARVSKKDKCGNIFRGKCVDIGSKDILAWSDKRILATIGLDNIIIVDTKDALLVCAKDKTQDVKKIVELLKRKKIRQQI